MTTNPRWKTLASLLLAVFLAAGAGLYAHASIPPAAGPSARVVKPEKGRVLVASGMMRDPMFSGTVILLIEHGWQGASGVILNRPMDITLSRALPGVKGLQGAKDAVWFGGPVDTGRMTMLIRASSPPPASGAVLPGVYASASAETLDALLASGNVARGFRMYVGFAGWAPTQLEAEIAQGGWHVLEADAADVFSEEPSGLWPRLMRRAGH